MMVAFLTAVKDEPKIQQHILNACNTSVEVFRNYRDKLVERGFLYADQHGYLITPAGRRALKQMQETLAIIDGKGGAAQ